LGASDDLVVTKQINTSLNTDCATEVALILGCGPTVYRDYNKFITEYNGVPYTVWAVNDIAAYFTKRIDHFVCIDKELIAPIKELRRQRHGNSDYKTHSLDGSDVDVTWNYNIRVARNSGLLAALAALHSGHKRVVLCGIPMDATGHFYELGARTKTDIYDTLINKSPWVSPLDKFKSRIRSYSGFTRKRWGEPTHAWVHGVDNVA